jgi:hypothetical protein
MQSLVRFGMQRVGQWARSHHATVKHLRPDCATGINFELSPDWSRRGDVVYAFVFDGKVRRIGETTRGMAERFLSYRYGNKNPKDTDNPVKLAITATLMRGHEVEIWACSPFARFELADGEAWDLPVSKPVEERLIAHFEPDLNVKNLAGGGR